MMDQDENGRYRAWCTLLWWGGVLTLGLKEAVGMAQVGTLPSTMLRDWSAGWEDVAGTWSAWGLVTYAVLKWGVKRPLGLKARLPLWRVLPLMVVVGVLMVLHGRRFMQGEESDWFSVVIPLLLLVILTAREWLFSVEARV